MIRVRKCGNTIEFEFPGVRDESGRAQLIHFGSEPEHDCLQRGHFQQKELYDFRRGVSDVRAGGMLKNPADRGGQVGLVESGLGLIL
jgi:hypothetical protein